MFILVILTGVRLSNSPLRCVDIYHCDWVRKEDDCPIAGQVLVRWTSQTERVCKEGEESEYHEEIQREDELAILRKGTKPHDRAQVRNVV